MDGPLDAVVPVVLQQLPMREDLDEYGVVFQALSLLFTGHFFSEDRCSPKTMNEIRNIKL